MRPALTPLAHSVADAAAMLGVSRKTLIRRIEDGTIRVVRLGKRLLVPFSEIERLLGPDVTPVKRRGTPK